MHVSVMKPSTLTTPRCDVSGRRVTVAVAKRDDEQIHCPSLYVSPPALLLFVRPLPRPRRPHSLNLPPPRPTTARRRHPQDEQQGLANADGDALGRAYAEVDSSVLYRVGETAKVVGVPT
jgi:hypothetical protein